MNERRPLMKFFTIIFVVFFALAGNASLADSLATAPAPILQKGGSPVDWWFVFKFNTKAFPGCASDASRICAFGGTPQDYKGGYSQQYAYASSANAELQNGSGCVGDTDIDPVGATFSEVYLGAYNYVIWNDQFYDHPLKSAASPWGHSKGMLAWNNDGEGFVMQVSTPSWPGACSVDHPREEDGNTLGCVEDNNVKVSQHFFALKLNKSDLIAVLQALQNASVVTDPTKLQIVRNGGPADVQALVANLGKKSKSTTATIVTLSSGVRLISKPSNLPVPPWQLVSAELNGLPLSAATWWANPKIPSTDSGTPIDCWDPSLGNAGAVEIATSGHWQQTTFNLTGGPGADFNHAKIGVSLDAQASYAIFGDLNQQGALSGNCKSSQNGRGGLFYVVANRTLNQNMAKLIQAGSSAMATNRSAKVGLQ